MRTQQFSARTVFVCLALCAGFSLFAQPAEGWPWRRAWVKQKMYQRHFAWPDSIAMAGLRVGLGCGCYKGAAEDEFPDCLIGMVPIWDFYGIPIEVWGGWWYYRITLPEDWAMIGVGCYGATAVAGLSYWWQGEDPVGLGPPFAGINFNSPVSSTGVSCESREAQPITYENIQYALIPRD